MAGPELPAGTTVETIFLDALGEIVAESDERRAGGEIVVTYPDGQRESTIFSLSDAPPPLI